MNKIAKAITAAIALGVTATSYAGFYVSGGDVYEGNGNKFVMRGINHAHTWYTDRLDQSLADIASVGSNTVRVVLSNGHRWARNSASDVANVIQKAKDNKLIAMLEVHDTTGYGEDGAAATLASAVDYWISIKDQLIGQEDYVFINIGNEPFGNGQSADAWISAHTTAITRLRNAGLTHTLIVDAPNWGQDWQNIMRDNASQVFNHDPNKNVVFSVHMYEVYNSYSAVSNYMSAFSNNGLPLIVGEFAATHKTFEVDEGSIMSLAVNNQIGYIGWSWDGNGASYGEIDIVNDWNANSLTSWGNILVNGSNGLKATSQIASIYGGSNNNSSNNNNDYPTCSSSDADPDGDGWGWENNQSCVVSTSNNTSSEYPSCSSAAVDADGDGWGWENHQSCIVTESTTNTDDSTSDSSTDNSSSDSNSSSTNDYPSCSSAAADPDGDGWGWENNQSCVVVASTNNNAPNGFPYCSSASVDPDGDGWGWENNQSCVVQGSAADS